MSDAAVEVVIPQEITAVVKREGLTEPTAQTLIGAFAPYHAQIARTLDASRAITDGEDESQRKLARACRLELRRVRCSIEDTRKTAKAEALKYGKAVDGLANVLKFLCEPEESRLDAIERYAEIIEQKRIAALVAERTAALAAVECDPSAYNLGAMDAETWATVIQSATKRRDDRIEAARKAEAERIAKEKADAEERERLRAENARLAAEREAAEKARRASEEKARKEREAAEKARIDAEQRALAAQREAQRLIDAERARAKAEQDAKEEKARKAKEEERRAARAPDRERVMAIAATVRGLQIPQAKSAEGRAIVAEITAKVEAFAKWIEAKAGELR